MFYLPRISFSQSLIFWNLFTDFTGKLLFVEVTDVVWFLDDRASSFILKILSFAPLKFISHSKYNIQMIFAQIKFDNFCKIFCSHFQSIYRNIQCIHFPFINVIQYIHLSRNLWLAYRVHLSQRHIYQFNMVRWRATKKLEEKKTSPLTMDVANWESFYFLRFEHQIRNVTLKKYIFFSRYNDVERGSSKVQSSRAKWMANPTAGIEKMLNNLIENYFVKKN